MIEIYLLQIQDIKRVQNQIGMDKREQKDKNLIDKNIKQGEQK